MQAAYIGIPYMNVLLYYWMGISILMLIIGAAVHIWSILFRSSQITRDIIGNVNETIVVYDKKDRPCFVNINYQHADTFEFQKRTSEAIDKSGRITNNFKESGWDEDDFRYFEGEIVPFPDNDTVLSWRMCPIIRNNKYMGRIFVFNDITQQKKLLEQLDHKNRQLKEALEEQRKYAEISKKLVAEEERERIMNLVNRIAGDYLEQLNECIIRMRKYAVGREHEDQAGFEAENEKMIRITRESISEIRNTVKALYDLV